MPAETHSHLGPIEPDDVERIVRDQLVDILGVDADSVGKVRQFGPHPSIAQRAIVTKIERRNALAPTLRDQQRRLVGGDHHAVGHAQAVGRFVSGSVRVNAQQRRGSRRLAAPHVIAELSDECVAMAIDTHVVDVVGREPAQIGMHCAIRTVETHHAAARHRTDE